MDPTQVLNPPPLDVHHVIFHEDKLHHPSFLTPWSFIHVLSGIMAYAIATRLFPHVTYPWRFVLWFCVHTLYEIWDFYTTYRNPHLLRNIHRTLAPIFGFKIISTYSNTYINSLGDTLAALFGFIISPAFFSLFRLVPESWQGVLFSIIVLVLALAFFIYAPTKKPIG